MHHEPPPSSKPTFLRNEATKSKGQQGMQSEEGKGLMTQMFELLNAIFNKLILPAKPQNAARSSASPLAGGPFADTRRGPTPPPGVVRHDHNDKENDER